MCDISKYECMLIVCSSPTLLPRPTFLPLPHFFHPPHFFAPSPPFSPTPLFCPFPTFFRKPHSATPYLPCRSSPTLLPNPTFLLPLFTLKQESYDVEKRQKQLSRLSLRRRLNNSKVIFILNQVRLNFSFSTWSWEQKKLNRAINF